MAESTGSKVKRVIKGAVTGGMFGTAKALLKDTAADTHIAKGRGSSNPAPTKGKKGIKSKARTRVSKLANKSADEMKRLGL